MTIEIKPQGVACNLACRYCYQEPMRKAGNFRTGPLSDDVIDRMISIAQQMGPQFSLFGGEVLLTPKEKLEIFFRRAFERGYPAGIQTSGNLIDEDHIAMFKRYKVGVGVSIDGPGELNELRVSRKTGSADEDTRRTLHALERMLEEGIGVSIIVTLHNRNGTPERLPRLLEWGQWLLDHGVVHVNVHTLESESDEVLREYGLSAEEQIWAIRTIAEWLKDRPQARWQPFYDIRMRLSLQQTDVLCTWNNCDPLTTSAVQGIEADGSLSNCGRPSKEGIPWVKADKPGFERQISLYQSPQSAGGCRGCRFWLLCGGSCPGEGQDRDWRNRTEHCATLIALFEFYEDELGTGKVLSLHPRRLEAEAVMQRNFALGRTTPYCEVLRILEGASGGTSAPLSGDHGDAPHGDAPHGDSPHGDGHGDAPHGDSHGDHTDSGEGGKE